MEIIMIMALVIGIGLTVALVYMRSLLRIEVELLNDCIIDLDEEIKKMVEYEVNLALAIKDIQNYLIKQQAIQYPFTGIMGEA